MTFGVIQVGIEDCAGRCLDASSCDYIRGEPQSSTEPGYTDCELLRCPDTLEGTGLQGDRSELRSRTCFSRGQSTRADVADISAQTALVAFAGAVLCFSLPLCWHCARKRSQSLAAARQTIVAMDLPPLGTNQPRLERTLDEYAGTQYWVVSKGKEQDTCDLSVVDVDLRVAEEAQPVSTAESTHDIAQLGEEVARVEAAAELARQRQEKEEREEQLVSQQREEEEKQARLRREEEQAEEKRQSAKRELLRVERERLARREAETAAAIEAELTRVALEEETARKVEEARRHDEEQRAWHLEQERIVAQEAKEHSDAVAVARAQHKAQKRLEKLASVSKKVAADHAASAARDAAAERVARRAREAISAMTPRSQNMSMNPSADESVMMSLVVGTPLPRPPRPIAQSILERHSDRQLIVFDSDDET